MSLKTEQEKKSASKSPYSEECKKTFRYWRLRTLYSIIIGYSTFYLVKQNFSYAIPGMLSDLHYTKTDIGLVISIPVVLYGILKCLFGMIADRNNVRYIMSVGLFLSAVMNIFMGLSSTIPAFIIFWSLNYCFQAVGVPSSVKLLKHWFSPVEIGTRWSLWSSSHEIGRMSTALLAMVVLPYFISWRYLFFIPAILAILSSILIFNRLRDTPESLNLPSIEKMAGIETGNEDSTEPRLTYVEILKTALSNKFVWIVSVANFFLYFCKTTFLTWGPTFLMERGISMCQTTWQMILLDAAGLIGGIGSGYLSDKVFKGRRGPISTMCMIALVAPVALLLASNSQSICSICMFCVGFVTSGPQLLIGIAATDFTSKKVAATANGFTGTLGYAGMAFSGVGTGLLVDHYGWNSVFFAIIFTALASAALLSLTWNKKAAILEKTAK